MKLPIFELQISLVHACYLLIKWLYNNQLYTLEPYLSPSKKGSAHKTADL